MQNSEVVWRVVCNDWDALSKETTKGLQDLGNNLSAISTFRSCFFSSYSVHVRGGFWYLNTWICQPLLIGAGDLTLLIYFNCASRDNPSLFQIKPSSFKIKHRKLFCPRQLVTQIKAQLIIHNRRIGVFSSSVWHY